MSRLEKQITLINIIENILNSPAAIRGFMVEMLDLPQIEVEMGIETGSTGTYSPDLED